MIRSSLGVLGVAATLAFSLPASADVPLPGTQPGELTNEIRPPSVCASCHGSYAAYAALDTWQGTMMANAARDPMFQAALTIANQDVPGSGDLCIRCHSPPGWLAGRSDPPDGSALVTDDYESVQCDFCHRLTSGPMGEHLIGSAQYFVADDFIRRGPFDALAPHESQQSSYFEKSDLCGLCHDVTNPLENDFPVERTYTEWKQSAYPDRDVQCQTCHMPATTGFACGAPGAPERTVHRHELAGGNWWMPLVLAGEMPELDREAAFMQTSTNARAKLRSAADLELMLPDEVGRGDNLAFTVRVTNRAGHKLPTGYPEGRRCWLEVIVTDAEGNEVLHSGGYDIVTASRDADDQLRTYEVELSADGEVGFHFIKQDTRVTDTRIPPEGFVPSDETTPLGRTYPVQPDGTLAHWDDAPYHTGVPGTVRGPLKVEARLQYQTTSREYIEFLRDENQTDGRGDHMHDLWEKYDRSPPVTMAETEAFIPLTGGTPDAGTLDGSLPDAATDGGDAGEPRPMGPKGGGCGCTVPTGTGPRGAGGATGLVALLLLGLVRRRRS